MSEMKAGRELDALVAEKVMGWTLSGRVWIDERGHLQTIEPTSFGSFEPSSDIAAAWEVVEKMRARGLIVDLTLGAGAYCRIGGFRPFAEERGATAPLAICLAALKAVQS